MLIEETRIKKSRAVTSLPGDKTAGTDPDKSGAHALFNLHRKSTNWILPVFSTAHAWGF
jgi:hypothetical protein